MKALMISGRTVDQGATIEAKTSDAYFKAVAFCEVNENDLASLGISEGENVLVRSEHGSVVVPAKVDNGLPDGMVFIPMGPYANAIVDPDTKGCGMPQYKGVECEVEPTDEQTLSVKELMKQYME